MKRVLSRCGKLFVLVLPLLVVGCDQEFRYMVIDQTVGVLSTLAAALTTSVIQGAISGGTTG